MNDILLIMAKSIISFNVLLCIFTSCLSPSVARHVVFILADDLGWNDVGFHNSDIITPHIDALAKEGVILNNSYVQPLCTPSRSALLTGVYPFRDGLQKGVLGTRAPSCAAIDHMLLPEKLKQIGYATHIVGKWHLGFCNLKCTPTYRGFDSFLGFYGWGEDYYSKKAFGFVDFHNETKNRFYNLNLTEYSTNIFADRAVEIIRTHNQSMPLFLYISFQAPHCPLQVPEKYLDLYPKSMYHRRRIYSGMVSAMDEAIGNITQALKEKGIDRETLLIFTSDNGGEVTNAGSNYPLRGAKTSIYEGGTRAVAFIRGDMLKKSSYTYDGLIHVVDWFPTIIAAAGGTLDDLNYSIDGVNQWDAIRTGGESARNEIVYNLDDTTFAWTGRAAIRVGDYKLVHGYPGAFYERYKPDEEYPSSACGNKLNGVVDKIMYKDLCLNRPMFDQKLLFNLKHDPCELIDLSEKLPDIVNELSERLDKYRTDVRSPIPDISDPKADPRLYEGFLSNGWC